MHTFLIWVEQKCLPSYKSRFCQQHNKEFELKQEAVMARISGLPQFSAVNWFLWNSWKRGWRSVLCFLSSLLIPHSSGRRESCLRIHGPCGKWRYSSSSPLSSSFHSVLQGLANPLPGHGGEIAGFFKAGWTSKLQGYRGTWGGGRKLGPPQAKTVRGSPQLFLLPFLRWHWKMRGLTWGALLIGTTTPWESSFVFKNCTTFTKWHSYATKKYKMILYETQKRFCTWY